jgi:hypothetical protein
VFSEPLDLPAPERLHGVVRGSWGHPGQLRGLGYYFVTAQWGSLGKRGWGQDRMEVGCQPHRVDRIFSSFSIFLGCTRLCVGKGHIDRANLVFDKTVPQKR